ncbi:Integrase catalytic core protein [Phytophthora cinnamomi]|uniref:Integrase catalytic core protein n=1 Tax=Phytophthora cinnamomi TaxID=4785 RepID=UPI0035597844|nr:Integrase catalytic core protein [Phytophthora cinnamomi]
MDASKDKVSRSAKLDEREVGGIYATHSPQHGMVIHVTKDGDAPTVQVETDRQPVEDEPMEAVEEPAQDVEMNETESEQVVLRLSPPERPATGLALTAYHPPPQAFQDDRLVFHPEPVRSRRSQESVFLLGNGLIAEAVMTYAGSITEATDLPETYA